MARTPAVPAANAKNSAEVRMTFFNMASLPIRVDHAVFYAFSATRCDGYHFSKTPCDFAHTSGKPIGALVSTTVAILTLRPTGLSPPIYRDQLDYTVIEEGRVAHVRGFTCAARV